MNNNINQINMGNQGINPYQQPVQIPQYTAPAVPTAQPVIYNVPNQQIYTPQAPIQEGFQGSSILKNYIIAQGKQPQAISQTSAINVNGITSAPVWKNNTKNNLRAGKVNMLAVIPRTMNAQDTDGNALIQNGEVRGNFINAVGRLDEIKAMGINTLHVLPIHPTSKTKAMGIAGSLYAMDDPLALDPNLKDPNTPGTVEEQCKYFINECHKRGISVMIDLPSCVSVDYAKKHPELMKKMAQTKLLAVGKISECSEYLMMKLKEN